MTDIDPALLNALGFHAVARQLDVSPDHIFLVPRLEDGRLGVVIGSIAFPVGTCALEVDDIPAAWERAVTWWNTEATQEERSVLFERVREEAGGVPLVLSINQAKATIGREAEALASIPWASFEEMMDKRMFVLAGGGGAKRVFQHRSLPVEVTFTFHALGPSGGPGFAITKLLVRQQDVLDQCRGGAGPDQVLLQAIDIARGTV